MDNTLTQVEAGTKIRSGQIDTYKGRVRVTKDNSAAGNVALSGYAHGGPSGATPVEVLFTRVATSGGGSESETQGAAPHVVGYDTTNDEIDLAISCTQEDAKVADYEVYVRFADSGAQDGSSLTSSGEVAAASSTL
jgi:hypothetical protein